MPGIQNDLNSDFTTKALETYIDVNHTIPSIDKWSSLIKRIGIDVLPKFAQELTKELIEDRKIFLTSQKRIQKKFESELITIWKEPLDLFECLIQVSLESGEKCKNKLADRGDKFKNHKHEAIVKIHARALHISNEILVLLKSGYADGAIARWRSLHELAVISFFLKEHDNEVSKRYLVHNIIRSYKEARDYKTYYKKLRYAPPNRREYLKLKREAEQLCRIYDDKFQDDYGWIPSSLMSDRNFRVLEKTVNLDKLRPFYNIACDAQHGGSKGFYRFGLSDDYQDKLFLVGSSSIGLADPLQNAALSLTHVSSCLLTLDPGFEEIINISVILNFVENIFEELDKLFIEKEEEAEDKANRETYNKLPPKEKMTAFVERMKTNYPDFDYKWVSLDEGNVKLEYGDKSLLITGIENEGAREEIAHGVFQIQKEIDALGEGDKK